VAVAFFITDSNELYADMAIKVDNETFAWLSQNGIDLGRKTSFTITKESPVFEILSEAEQWIRETKPPYQASSNPREWGDRFVGRLIPMDKRIADDSDWEFVGDEGRLVFGYQLNGEAFLTTFPPTQSPPHHDVTIAIIVRTSGHKVTEIRELVVLRDNWGDYHELDAALFPPDIEYAEGLVEKLLSEKK
jgi:hypothetical protein